MGLPGPGGAPGAKGPAGVAGEKGETGARGEPVGCKVAIIVMDNKLTVKGFAN